MDFDQENSIYTTGVITIDDNVTITGTGNYDWGNVTLSSNQVYTTNHTGGLYCGANGTSTAELSQAGRLSLRGDKADIEINGESLMTTLKSIQEQLNILTPDPRMEADWEELADIRRQYAEKLRECQDKARVWDILKTQVDQ